MTIVKLESLVSLPEWTEISERNSNLIENLKKGPDGAIIQIYHPPTNNGNLLMAKITRPKGLLDPKIHC